MYIDLELANRSFTAVSWSRICQWSSSFRASADQPFIRLRSILADEPMPGRSLVTPFLTRREKHGSLYDLFQSVHCPWFSHSSPMSPASFIFCGKNHKRSRCNKQIIRVSGQILTTKESSGSEAAKCLLTNLTRSNNFSGAVRRMVHPSSPKTWLPTFCIS